MTRHRGKHVSLEDLRGEFGAGGPSPLNIPEAPLETRMIEEPDKPVSTVWRAPRPVRVHRESTIKWPERQGSQPAGKDVLLGDLADLIARTSIREEQS